MKIVVCIKQVPDTSEVKLDPKTNTLIRDGVPSIINPDDKSGIEAALRIKEQVGGTVTVVCMGPPQADVAIREALAMGCETVFLFPAENSADQIHLLHQQSSQQVLRHLITILLSQVVRLSTETQLRLVPRSQSTLDLLRYLMLKYPD